MENEYILGIGCRRGTPIEDIEKAVLDVLNKNSILKEDMKRIASVDLKADEIGLLEFAQKWNLGIKFFTQEELDSVSVPNPSEKVIEKIGVSSVCEAAAKLAGSGELIVEKQKYGNVTVAVGKADPVKGLLAEFHEGEVEAVIGHRPRVFRKVRLYEGDAWCIELPVM